MKLKNESKSVDYRIAGRLFVILLITFSVFFINCVLAEEISTNAINDSKDSLGLNDLKSENFFNFIEKMDNYKANLTPSQEKIPSQILALIDPNFPKSDVLQLDTGAVQGMIDGGYYLPATETSVVGKTADGLIFVYIDFIPDTPLDTVDRYLYKVVSKDKDSNSIAAWVPLKNIEQIADKKQVQNIQIVFQPETQSGSVTTQGDIVHRTNQVRSTYGNTGTNVKIGVISDGVDHISNSIASGDLPSNVHVLSNNIHPADEGTAMLEIVYDMAPGAELYFHDHGNTIAEFNDAINELVTNGCKIICDDTAYLDEPVFQDGTNANHISSVISTSNVVYIVSSANYALTHYRGEFYPSNPPYIHDFSNGGTIKQLFVTIPAGAKDYVALQWNDPWGSSTNDYDLYLYDPYTGIVASSTTRQNGNNKPLEILTYTNTGGYSKTYEIRVVKYSGITKVLDLKTTYRQGLPLTPSSNLVSSSSIPGGAQSVSNAITVAAINQATPSGSIEPYSSRGPITLYFPSYQTRNKPDITGVDNVITTNPGNGGFNPFIGTSAAAPHIAGIVADIWSGFPSRTSQQLRTALYNSAVDLSPAGYDTSSGYGRADAMAMRAII